MDPRRSRLAGDTFASGTVAVSTLTEHLPAVAAAVFAQPAIAAAFTTMTDKVTARRARNFAELLESAAAVAGLTPEEFGEEAVRDDPHIEYTVAAFTAGVDMAEDKRRALGLALAAAVAGDDAVVDDEFLFLDALRELRAPHIRLLALLARTRRFSTLPGMTVEGGWTREDLAAADPGLADTLPPLLATVVRHALAEHPASFSDLTSDRLYNITARGQLFLHRLGPDPSPCRGAEESDRGTKDQ